MAIRNCQVLCPDKEGLSGTFDLFKDDNEGHFLSMVQGDTSKTFRLEDFGEEELTILARFIVEVIDKK